MFNLQKPMIIEEKEDCSDQRNITSLMTSNSIMSFNLQLQTLHVNPPLSCPSNGSLDLSFNRMIMDCSDVPGASASLLNPGNGCAPGSSIHISSPNFCRLESDQEGRFSNKGITTAGGGVISKKSSINYDGNDMMDIGGVGSVSMKKKSKANRKKMREPRFCFKTVTEVDLLDDGYKWRKYGQKVVKNTQHPSQEFISKFNIVCQNHCSRHMGRRYF